ncbi:MAG: DNA pilot protein [Microviridae sp.]|nr:MAG: DNA pilot protein [Microviridae sp.]
MPIWIPLAIAAGVQTAANLISQRKAQKIQARNVEMTNQANLQQANLAYQREQEMIEKQNNYNSPTMQMQRFQDAGLNKNLVYTQGNPGNQSQIAKYQAPNMSYDYKSIDYGSAIKPMTDLPLVAQQFNNLVSQGKILKAESIMKTALSNFADEIAKSEATIKFNEGLAQKFKRVFQEEEFNRFFRYDEKQNKYFLKEGVEDTFVNNLAAKWLQPSTELERTQANVTSQKMSNEVQQALLELQKKSPGLKLLFEFLRLIKLN